MDCGALFKLIYSLVSVFKGQCHKNTNNFISLKILVVTLHVFLAYPKWNHVPFSHIEKPLHNTFCFCFLSFSCYCSPH